MDMGRITKTLRLATLALSLPLSSCIFDFSDDGWKKYYTPELFLEHAKVHQYVTVHSTEVDAPGVLDYDFEVKNAILDAAPFESISTAGEKSARFLSYEILRSHATSGPNYSNMYVYDNGLLQIDFKASLGSLHSFYYKFDEAKAKALNAFGENRIRQSIAEEEADLAKAKEDGSIWNLLVAIEGASVIPVWCWKDRVLHECYDDGRLLNVLKNTTFEPLSSATSFNAALIYNTGNGGNSPTVRDWYFNLSADLAHINVIYFYRNRHGLSQETAIPYSLDSRQGQAIINTAFSIPSNK